MRIPDFRLDAKTATNAMWPSPEESQYKINGFGGDSRVLPCSAFSSAFAHHNRESSRSSVIKCFSPWNFAYCRIVKGCRSTLPTRPKSRDCERPKRPRNFAACDGVKFMLRKHWRISFGAFFRLRSGREAVIQSRAIEIWAPSKRTAFAGRCSLELSRLKPSNEQTVLKVSNAMSMVSAGSIINTSSTYTAIAMPKN